MDAACIPPAALYRPRITVHLDQIQVLLSRTRRTRRLAVHAEDAPDSELLDTTIKGSDISDRNDYSQDTSYAGST